LIEAFLLVLNHVLINSVLALRGGNRSSPGGGGGPGGGGPGGGGPGEGGPGGEAINQKKSVIKKVYIKVYVYKNKNKITKSEK
jgi:hypothetical protein